MDGGGEASSVGNRVLQLGSLLFLLLLLLLLLLLFPLWPVSRYVAAAALLRRSYSVDILKKK